MPRAIVEMGAGWDWGWDTLVALGTLGLAIFTALLAFATNKLAAASRADEEAQWRPVLVSAAASAPVSYDEQDGELAFEVRNVGRGPAFGVGAQLRSGKQPLGASVPTIGGAVALGPGEHFQMRARLTKPEEHTRGRVIEATISCDDIAERIHEAVFTISAYVPRDRIGDPSYVPELMVHKVIPRRTSRFLPAVSGGSTAAATAQAESVRKAQADRK
jgi:hypothetical protein